ncbi:E3 ubiquitin--protein ligase [Haloterrigena alkaliphila]|uniref:E3 ubiquitin--protein ligase n=1 Tax=Haloterrigena alkaliphila TaxID=2816475 RepID=A0A8A2VDI0_9EURY|nr:E3 ubiquitin--protein ligase [Haloterrigena alkaliphila]QSX00124.1 E3 ubiquitin ligase family protein [Haloterrigena alkaliphila]
MTPAQLEPVSIAVLALGAIVAVPFCWYGLTELRVANRVLRVEPDSVFDATDGGRVELRGTAQPVEEGRLVRAPFTGTPCLAYEYEVEQYDSSGKGSSWRTIDSGEGYVPFLLDDGANSMLIEPPGADFRLEADERIDVDGGTAPPERIARFIEATDAVDCQNTTVDLRVFELTTGADRRFRERRLEPGETVHVLGTARYDTTVSRAAGQINAAVGVDDAALAESRWIRLRHSLFGDPFVVSDSSERRLGLRSGGSGLLSLAVGVLAAWLAVSWAL